jgi:prophage regulatory protein
MGVTHGASRRSEHSEAAMRLLSKKQVREVVLYAPAHIDRLEKAGRFPKRVRLGPGRVGWVEDEVMEWLRVKIAERDTPTRPR